MYKIKQNNEIIEVWLEIVILAIIIKLFFHIKAPMKANLT